MPTFPSDDFHCMSLTKRYHLLAAATNSDINLEQAKTVLLWTKARIETVDIPHNCGLTNGALDVLGKLATRGDEAGWFGA